MGCTEDIHGVVVEVEEDNCTVEFVNAFDETDLYCAWECQYDLNYAPAVGDRVVVAWFGNDEEPVIRLEHDHG